MVKEIIQKYKNDWIAIIYGMEFCFEHKSLGKGLPL